MFGWTIRPRLYENGVSAAYLSDMAAKGWHFRRLGFNMVLFKKGAPAKVRYAVDVMSDAYRKVDEKLDSRHIQEYIRICEEGGWRFIDNDGALYVFAAKSEAAAPMQTDPTAYEESMFSLRKKKLTGLLLTFVLLLVITGNILWVPHRYLAWRWGPAMWLEGVLVLGDVLFRIGYVAWTLMREHMTLSMGKIPKEAYGRWVVWITFVLEGCMLFVMATTICQLVGLWVWLGIPGFLLLFFLLCVLQEGLQKLGWRSLHCSQDGVGWLGRLPILLTIMGTNLILFGWGQKGRLLGQTNEPPAGWQPVVEAEDFGWDSELKSLNYSSSFCAQTYEMWEGTGKEQLWSILYTSEIEALLDSFYNKGPLHSDWWNQGQKIEEQTKLDAGLLGIEEGTAWYTGNERWHYLLRAGDRALYLMAGQALSEEQLAIAAKKICESAS